jgi:hypothetical protein
VGRPVAASGRPVAARCWPRPLKAGVSLAAFRPSAGSRAEVGGDLDPYSALAAHDLGDLVALLRASRRRFTMFVALELSKSI